MKTHPDRRRSVIQVLLFTAIAIGGNDLAVSQTRTLDSFATVAPASNYESAILESEARLLNLIDSGAPGVSVAVGVDGSIVWAEGYGYANIELGVPVTPLTKFRIGSVSKPMTSIATAILYERESLDLDAPVQNYVENFPVKEEGTITPRLLAYHRSGIRHYRQDASDVFITDHYDNVVDALEIFADDPLLFAPGNRFSYSSHGYNLLSAVVQEASGVDFLTFMREDVWAPLNLLNTVADHRDHIIAHRASAYTRLEDGTLRNGPYVDNSYKWASGGFLSTPSDLVLFGFGVFESGILKDDTLQLLTSPYPADEGAGNNRPYGLGWAGFPAAGEGWTGHGGSSIGGNTLFLVHPEARVVVAVACNIGGCFGTAGPAIQGIGNLFIE